MKHFEKVKAVLLLEDGSCFYGKSAGKIGTATGEICFNTGMTGYQEIFTDPSYFGQIMLTTNVHIGNYGIKYDESESKQMSISGLVCNKFTNLYSRRMADTSIQEYFLEENMVGISDVDTRMIVRHIRSKGAMNAIISSESLDINELKEKLQKVPSMKGLELSSKVSTEEAYILGNHNANYKVAVLDLGVKKSILNNFVERGCCIKVFPAKSTYEEMEEWAPDGYFFSNGPGDPSSTKYAVKELKKVLENKKPFFGICLGHQVFALALGIKTYKMHAGHRGLNHPVKNLISGHSEITTQNHGFAIDEKAVKNCDFLEITHVNLNDHTIEGIKHKKQKAFSVQYHPEACPGPHDSHYLFDEFIDMLKD